MRWHVAEDGAEWSATVTPEGQVRLTRRWVKPPYREGDKGEVAYADHALSAEAAWDLGTSLKEAHEDAKNRQAELEAELNDIEQKEPT
jgi:hypothetical protein